MLCMLSPNCLESAQNAFDFQRSAVGDFFPESWGYSDPCVFCLPLLSCCLLVRLTLRHLVDCQDLAVLSSTCQVSDKNYDDDYYYCYYY